MWETGVSINRCLSGQSAFMLLNIYICHLFFFFISPPFGLLSKPVSIFNRGFLQKQSTSWGNPFLNEVYKLLCKDWHFCGFYRTVAVDRAHGDNLLRSPSRSPSKQRRIKRTLDYCSSSLSIPLCSGQFHFFILTCPTRLSLQWPLWGRVSSYSIYLAVEAPWTPWVTAAISPRLSSVCSASWVESPRRWEKASLCGAWRTSRGFLDLTSPTRWGQRQSRCTPVKCPPSII